MATTKVAVVTGSNKGIGFGIVRGLCKQFDGHVYLTSRDEGRGKEAVAKLEAEGLHPKLHQLDIDDAASVERLRQYLADKYGGIDILVNNAGIAYKNESPAPFSEQAEVTLKTNYWSTLQFYDTMKSLLRPYARVVHMSSMMSLMALSRCSDELKSKLKSCQTIDQVSQFMNKFVSDVKAGKHTEEGWPQTAYGISKVGVTLMTQIQQRQLDADTSKPDVVINACCPGYVATDMSSFKGTKTIDEGADTPLYLALLPPNVDSPRGKFVSDRTIKEY